MHRLYAKANGLTETVIESAIAVQKHFGIGLMESIYQKCLAHELRLKGHDVEVEKIVTISYKGFNFDEKLRIDLLVDDCLVVECKSLDEEKVNMVRHKAQTLSYMKLMDIPLGLVVNFGNEKLGKRGVTRVILKGADKGEDENVPF